MVTLPLNRNCGGRCEESAWGEWGSVLGCREMCWGVGEGKEKCVGSGEVWESVWGEWGGVWESVWGRGSVLACGEKMWGEEWERCREMCWVWGPNTLPNISLTSPFSKSPLTSFTPQHTFLHLSLIPLPTSPLPRPISQHIFLLSPHLPSPQSVAKLPCDEVSVAKLPCGEVPGNLD